MSIEKTEAWVKTIRLLTKLQKKLQLHYKTITTQNCQKISCMEVQQPKI